MSEPLPPFDNPMQDEVLRPHPDAPHRNLKELESHTLFSKIAETIGRLMTGRYPTRLESKHYIQSVDERIQRLY